MDFLRDFRTHSESPQQEAVVQEQAAAWQPSAEVVLTQDHLVTVGTPGAAPAAPARPGPADWAPPEPALPPPAAPTDWSPPSGPPVPLGWAPPGYPPPGRRPPPRRTAVVVAVLAACALVVGGGAFLVGRRLDKPAYPKTWDTRAASIAAFVSKERGLAWKHPVYMTFQSPAQFARQLLLGSQSSARQQSGLDALRAFGLIWGHFDASQLDQHVADNDVESFYDPARHTVYVKGESLTPSIQATIAYELDQALLDQYFDLQSLESSSADDEGAVSALVAGDADRVQAAFVQSLPNAEQQALAQELQRAATAAKQSDASAGVPQFLVDQLSFADNFGSTFVTALLKEGGTPELNAAYRNPPRLDGQIIDASSYEPGLPVPTVSAPSSPAGARVTVPPEGFGEMPLVEMLGDAIGSRAAWQAVQGWSADRGVVYAQSGQTCAALNVLEETAADAQALGGAGLRWAHFLPGATVTVSGRVVDFRSCDPGPGWRPADASPDPYQALSTRAFWIGSLVAQTDMNIVTATCVVDGLMTALGPGTLQSAEAASAGNAAGAQVAGALPRAAVSCGYTPPSSAS